MASNPDIELSSQVRDLFDSYQFKNVFYRFLPGIKTINLIRVPKLLEPLTIENIDKLEVMGDWESEDYGGRLSEVIKVPENQASDQFEDDKFVQIRILSDEQD